MLSHEGSNVNDADKAKVVEALNRILEAEMAGVGRYTHYSLMVYGYTRIPIVGMVARTGFGIVGA